MAIRDSHGRFIKSASSASTPPITPIPEFEKPLVSVNINNPFKRILYWLDQIRRHQTTTFAFKLSIPLIAIPIIIAALFTYARFRVAGITKVNPTPTPTINASPNPTLKVSPAPSAAPLPITNRTGTLRIAVGNQTTYLLALRNGTLVVLDVPNSIELNKFKDKQVLVTGTLNTSTGILTVTEIAEVQPFGTPTPQATSSAQ